MATVCYISLYPYSLWSSHHYWESVDSESSELMLLWSSKKNKTSSCHSLHLSPRSYRTKPGISWGLISWGLCPNSLEPPGWERFIEVLSWGDAFNPELPPGYSRWKITIEILLLSSFWGLLQVEKLDCGNLQKDWKVENLERSYKFHLYHPGNIVLPFCRL